MKEDIEVLKVKVYSDSVHSRFASLLAYEMSSFIGLYILFVTVALQNSSYVELCLWGLFFLFTLYIPIGYLCIWRPYLKKLAKLSRMIETLNRGEALPSLEEIAELKRHS